MMRKQGCLCLPSVCVWINQDRVLSSQLLWNFPKLDFSFQENVHIRLWMSAPVYQWSLRLWLPKRQDDDDSRSLRTETECASVRVLRFEVTCFLTSCQYLIIRHIPSNFFILILPQRQQANHMQSCDWQTGQMSVHPLISPEISCKIFFFLV